MIGQKAGRFTIDKIDKSTPLAEWKPLLADRGRRRHLCYAADFDSRAHLFSDPYGEWTVESKIQHLQNQERARMMFAKEFGEMDLDRKILDFVEMGFKPYSVLSYHNNFFNQVRRSFTMGAYYPALVGACALGERMLNHLVLDLRSYYKSTPEYKTIYRNKSFDNWKKPIDVLEEWGILLPNAVAEFRNLMELRHRSVHFNAQTYTTAREDALASIHHVREIIDQQFTALGIRPWIISGTSGHCFIKKEWEDNPFIREYYVKVSPFVGPYFSMSSINTSSGRIIYDHHDYGDGEWTDEEFVAAYEARSYEQLATVNQGPAAAADGDECWPER